MRHSPKSNLPNNTTHNTAVTIHELGNLSTSNLNYFGFSLAMSEYVMVVGQPNDVTYNGAVFLYNCQSSGCMQFMTLYASDAANNDQFGSSVAIDTNFILVGAPNKNNQQGAVYIFNCIETLSGGELR